jgi:hypothetical protein
MYTHAYQQAIDKGSEYGERNSIHAGMEMTSTTEGGKGVRRQVWEELSTGVHVCKEEDQRGRKEHAELVD